MEGLFNKVYIKKINDMHHRYLVIVCNDKLTVRYMPCRKYQSAKKWIKILLNSINKDGDVAVFYENVDILKEL